MNTTSTLPAQPGHTPGRNPENGHAYSTVEPQLTQGGSIAALTTRKFRVPGDVVNVATADLPDDQRSAVRWLHSFASERNLSYSELAAKVGYDESTLSRVFNGKYAGDLAAVCAQIESLKKLEEERATVHRAAFVETSLTKRIWQVCDAARIYQGFFGIKGDSQIGKTTALEEYQRRNNHGATIYVRVPEGGQKGSFIAELARKLRISPQLKATELEARIFAAFDERMILIVDEAHQCLRSITIKRGLRTLEFIRELQERAKCGVVLSMTEEGWEQIDQGKHAKMLQQVKRRCTAICALPPRPPARDLHAFAAAFNLPPAPEDSPAHALQTDTIHYDGLGKWLKTLTAASRLAAKNRKPLTWDLVVKAGHGIRAMEGGEWKEGN